MSCGAAKEGLGFVFRLTNPTTHYNTYVIPSLRVKRSNLKYDQKFS